MSAIYTASWRALYLASQEGSPPVQGVRISYSTPRYWSEAADFPVISELIPTFRMRDLEGEEFRAAYLAHLERVGRTVIENRLKHIADRSNLPLALVCFERSPSKCHRGIVAEWMGGLEEWYSPPLMSVRVGLQLPLEWKPAIEAEIEKARRRKR